MKAHEIMTQPVIVVNEETTLEEVARLMLDHGIGCVPVVDAAGKVVGIITESDFVCKEHAVPFSVYRAPQLFGEWLGKDDLERLYQAGLTLTAAQVMTTPVVTVSEDATLQDVVDRMMRHDITRVPVVRDGVPVGVIARHDLLRAMVDDAVRR